MAKQSGIHQLRGKVRGMSYYGQKGVQDGLVRKINEGLSTRVKNDAAYVNTRLNAAEFGTAGSFAGAAIRAVAEKKRAMMKDFATGDLAKVVRAEFLKDDTNPWGKRQFVGSEWRDVIREKLNQYAKLPWSDTIGAMVVGSTETSETGAVYNVALNAPEGWGSLLLAKGATSVVFEAYFVGFGFDASGDAPYRSLSTTIRLGADEGSLLESLSIEIQHTEAGGTLPIEVSNNMNSFLVVAKPVKEIGPQKYVLQELCTYIEVY